MNFGENGQYLRCPLCSQLGGAMKETSVDISIFQSSNTEYYQNFSKSKTPKPTTLDFTYNFLDAYQNTLKLFDDPYIAQKEPHPHKVWAHLSCIFWTPECYIDDRDALKGIETVDKKRFYLQCSVCGQRRQGACVQCSRGQCQIAFHPECARRANKLMSIQLTSANRTEYTLYCEKHTPFKLKRIIETKHRQYEREIIDFFKSFERFKSQVNKQTKKKMEQKSIKKQLKRFQKQIKRKNRLVNTYFIKFSDDELHSFAVNFKVYIDKILCGCFSVDMKKEGKIYTVTSISIPDIPIIPEYKLRIIPDFVKPQSELERSVLPFYLGNIPADDIIWSKFEFKFYDRQKLFRIYKRTTFTAEKVYFIMFTKKNSIQKPLLMLTDARYKKEVKVLEKLLISSIDVGEGETETIDKNIYCICREQFKNNNHMIQCEECDEWYHYDCLGLKQNEIQLDDLNYYCFMCEDDLDAVQKKKIRNPYKKIFDDPFFTMQRQLAKQMNFKLIRAENLRNKKEKEEKKKLENEQIEELLKQKNQEQIEEQLHEQLDENLKNNENQSQIDENKSKINEKQSQINENQSQFNENQSQISENESQLEENYSLFDENQSQINENLQQNEQYNEQCNDQIMVEEQLQQQSNQLQENQFDQPQQLDVITQVCEIRQAIQQEEMKQDLNLQLETNLQQEMNVEVQRYEMKERPQKKSNLKQLTLEETFKLKQ